MNVLYVWELPYQVGHLVFDVFAEDASASEHNCVVNRRPLHDVADTLA
jgi:hypothetical protein